MAESELSIKFADLKLEVADFLGYGTVESSWSVDQASRVERYVQTGVRRFYHPPAVEGVEAGYPWSFLKPVGTITTVASDVAQDLPGNVGRVTGDFHYDEDQHRNSVVVVSEEQYQISISRTETAGAPQIARVRHKPMEGALGQRLEVAFWPIPDAAYVFTFRYEAYSGKLSEAQPYPLGGSRHSELVVQSCLAVAEQRANDERGLHTSEFERSLKAAIQQDRRLGARHYGHMGDFSDRPVSLPRSGDTAGTYPITFNGVDINA